MAAQGDLVTVTARDVGHAAELTVTGLGVTVTAPGVGAADPGVVVLTVPKTMFHSDGSSVLFPVEA